MINIIVGEDTASSRRKLNEILSEFSNIARFDGKKSNLSEIDTAFISNSMFDDKKTVVIEQFSKVKPQDKFLEILNRFEDDNNINILLWDEVALPAKFKSFKKTKFFAFDFPKVYFQFMYALSPKSSTENIKLLGEVLKTYEPEQILYSIIKRLRQLLILKSENYHEFSEFAKMQDWQIGKLRKQANNWTEDDLKKAFLEYVALDEKIKTSALTMDLRKYLDILLAADLN